MAPGPADTQMVRDNPPELVEAVVVAALSGRIVRPDEEVGAALLSGSEAGHLLATALASPETRYGHRRFCRPCPLRKR